MPKLSDLVDKEDAISIRPVAAELPVVAADPNAFAPDTTVVGSKLEQLINRLTGANGVDRYQLWPEKVVREGLSAAGDVLQEGALPAGLRREDVTDIPAPNMPTKDSTAWERFNNPAYSKDSTWLGRTLNIAPVAAEPSDKLVEQAQAMSALAGSGGLGGVGEEAGAALGAGPFLRPALKHEGKIYKAPMNGQHLDALPEHLAQDFQTKAMSGEDISHYDFGFMNHKGQFLNREKALEYAIEQGLVDQQAGKYGALTSTLLADSSKPGTAIEAMAKTLDPKLLKLKEAGYNIDEPLYHQSNETFNKIKPSYGSQVWFSNSKDALLDNGAVGNKKVATAYMKNGKLASREEYEKYGTDELIAKGYDGARLEDTIVHFKPENVKIHKWEDNSQPLTIRGAGQEIGHESLADLTKPNHFYRGMSEAEYNNTIGAGKPMKSNESGSIPGEGTNFSHDARDAESYANFGRSDPRKTGNPNYLVEVKGSDGLKQARDGYFKAAGEIHPDRVTSVIKMEHDGNGAIIGKILKADSSKEGAALQSIKEPFFSALEHGINKLPDEALTGEQWLSKVWEPETTKKVGIRDEKNKVVLDENGKPKTKDVVIQGKSPLPGVKPEELDWTGLKSYLEENKGKPVTKAQIQEHLANNKVELKEVVKTRANHANPDFHYPDEAKYHSYQLPGGENYREMLLTLPERQPKAFIERDKFVQELKDKYGKDTWDMHMSPEEGSKFKQLQDQYFKAKNAEDYDPSKPYKSSHWDEPNILAHVRMNDRNMSEPGFAVQNTKSGDKSQAFATEEEAKTYQAKLPASVTTKIVSDTIPKKSLHLEEIQSDWHQQGRDKGYSPKENINDLLKQEKEVVEKAWLKESGGKYKNYTEAMEASESGENFLKMQNAVARHPELVPIREKMDAVRSGVPDAPFKKTWHELALKRMLREAAEKGYDRLSWTPGEAQAARYDLSKKINDIQIKPASEAEGGKHVTLNAPSGVHGSATIDGSGKIIRGFDAFSGGEGKNLSDFVGKDLATKILKTEGETKLAGDGLKVGGEGMKGFYDGIIPKALEKIGKEHGVKVKQGHVEYGDKRSKNYTIFDEGEEVAVFATREQAENYLKNNPGELVNGAKKEPIHYIDLPQSLKDTAMRKGFPLFSSGFPGYQFIPTDQDPFKKKQK